MLYWNQMSISQSFQRERDLGDSPWTKGAVPRPGKHCLPAHPTPTPPMPSRGSRSIKSPSVKKPVWLGKPQHFPHFLDHGTLFHEPFHTPWNTLREILTQHGSPKAPLLWDLPQSCAKFSVWFSSGKAFPHWFLQSRNIYNHILLSSPFLCFSWKWEK